MNTVFNNNGKPVPSRVNGWCDSNFERENWNRVNIQGKPSAKKSDWKKGCAKAVMGYTLRR